MSYSILSRAGDDPVRQGELVGWHLDHLANAEARLQTETAAIEAQRAALQERMARLDEAEQTAKERFERDTRWDLWMLRDYYETAPQFRGAKRKSADFGGYVVGSRVKTLSKTKVIVLDSAYMKTAFPDCVETTLRMADVMKGLRVTNEGKAVFSDTGEMLPETAVRVEPGSTVNAYYVEGPNGRYEVGREPPEWEFGTDYDATDETEEGSNDGSNGSDDEQES
jgi:hypothetical protein